LPEGVGFRVHSFHGICRQCAPHQRRGQALRVESGKRRDAVRNSCPVCSSLVFGGELGKDDSFTIYAGSLDDPSSFHPTVAIFAGSRPPWVVIPPGLKIFERMPSDENPPRS
jgi:hypothetical protein